MHAYCVFVYECVACERDQNYQPKIVCVCVCVCMYACGACVCDCTEHTISPQVFDFTVAHVKLTHTGVEVTHEKEKNREQQLNDTYTRRKTYHEL